MTVAVYLTHVDPGRNMARFYTMSVQPTLFGECSVVREWGRIGTGGQVKTASYPSWEDAEAALRLIERQKLRRGYSSTNG